MVVFRRLNFTNMLRSCLTSQLSIPAAFKSGVGGSTETTVVGVHDILHHGYWRSKTLEVR